MKLHIELDTVAVVKKEDLLYSPDGTLLGVQPPFASRILRETVGNVPDTDIRVSLEEIKGEKDLPQDWEMNCIPFFEEEDRTIRDILEQKHIDETHILCDRHSV
jgi:hypothetical protein